MSGQHTWSDKIKLDPTMSPARMKELEAVLDTVFDNPLGQAELEKLDHVVTVRAGAVGSHSFSNSIEIGDDARAEKFLREDGAWRSPTDLRLVVHELVAHHINGLDDRREREPEGGSIIPDQGMVTNVEYTNWFLSQLKDVPAQYQEDASSPRLGYDFVIRPGEEASPQEQFMQSLAKAFQDGKIDDEELERIKKEGEAVYPPSDGDPSFSITRNGDWVSVRAIDSQPVKVLFNNATGNVLFSDYEQRADIPNNTEHGFPDFSGGSP